MPIRAFIFHDLCIYHVTTALHIASVFGIFHENKIINVYVEFGKYHGINFYSIMFYEIVLRIT